MKHSLRIGFLTCALAGLVFAAGCTTTDESNELLAQAAVQHATGKVIEAGADPVQRAARVYELASGAKDLLVNEAVTLPQLEQAVRDRLVTDNLTPADLVLVDTLLRVISLELARQVGSQNLNADQKVKVDKVLSWVIAAATITQPSVTTSSSS